MGGALGFSVSFTPLSMWQYSSTGTVSGISGAVDLDYSYKDYSKIITPRTTAKKVTVKTGWQTDGTNYWYVKEDGSIYKKTFKTINGNRYYFDANGYRATGWKKIGGKYYYFVKKTGVMKKGWLTLSGKKYYLGTNGVRVTKWKKISGKWYYFGPKTGAMQKNMKIGKYKLGKDGVCINRK